MSWGKVKLSEVLKQYRIEHLVQNDIEYKQVTISKYDGVTFRGTKIGKEIGRKRQFQIDLKKYPNTLMFVRQGVQDGSIGIANSDVDGCIATENMPMFSIETIDVEYLRFILKSPYFNDELKKIATTGSAQKSIHERQILEIEIPYPNPKEQKKIVNELSKLKDNSNSISTELTHQLTLVKKLRQQLLQDAVKGKLVEQNKKDEPASELLKKIKAEKEKLIAEKKLKKEKELAPIKAEEIPFEIPENWVWCRLKDVCLKITDGTHFSPTNIETGKYKYITAKNIKDSGIDLTKISYVTEEVHQEIYSRCNPEYGDILYIKDGATTGIVTINDLTEEFSMLSSVALIKLPSTINNRFLMQLMRSPFYYNFTRDDMSGVAITRVTLEKIQKALIPLPPLSEQKRIVQKLDELMQYCNDLEASIKQSASQNEKLLQQVLREALRKEPVEV
jgi:restriction endonuclease S subunit